MLELLVSIECVKLHTNCIIQFPMKPGYLDKWLIPAIVSILPDFQIMPPILFTAVVLEIHWKCLFLNANGLQCIDLNLFSYFNIQRWGIRLKNFSVNILISFSWAMPTSVKCSFRFMCLSVSVLSAQTYL